MVGKKAYKNTHNQIESVTKSECDNFQNSEFILDLDELHMNVTPPSELNENCSPKTEDKRKKVRYHRHILNFAVDTQHANNKCHQCRRKNLKYGLFKCSRKECSILYCAICIKKYNQQFNTCFYCQRVCKCKVCRKKFDNNNNNYDELSEECDFLSCEDKSMFKIDDFIIIERKDSEFDIEEKIPFYEEVKKKRKTKSLNDVKKEFKKIKLKINNRNYDEAFINKKDSNYEASNEKDLNKINLSDEIILNDSKIKNINQNKIKNMKEENSDNPCLNDKVSEKFYSENYDKVNSLEINASKDNLIQESVDSFRDEYINYEKFSEKLNDNLNIQKNINNKYKLKKNDTINSNPNNFIDACNENNNPNKKVKNKKEKTENLKKMEKFNSANDGQNNNQINKDCIKSIEIPSNNYIKSKKSVYKNCLYCKNDKINIMTILRFKSSEEFIFYSKHFYERLSGENLKIYNESKNNFERYYNDYYKKCSQSNNFTFKSIKYICISCFEENLKDEDGFSNVLNTLQYGLNPVENKISLSKNKENTNLINSSNIIENIKDDKTFNMEPNIDLHFISEEKVELLKRKKKYIKKKMKNNNLEEEKVQSFSNTPMNLNNISNILESNVDKDIINNLINNNKIKKMQMNENNNNTISITNNTENINKMNSGQKTLNNNNVNNSNNHIIPTVHQINGVNMFSRNSQNNNNNSANFNSISNQENNNNSNNLIISSNSNINKNSMQNYANQNSNQNKTHDGNNSSNGYLKYNPNLNLNSNRNLNSSQNPINQNKAQIENFSNDNNNTNNYHKQITKIDNDSKLNTDSKLDNLNNLISQGIDELYNTTKENLANINESGMNVTNIIMNFEQNKEELSNKLNLKYILDDLKKQFLSINYYSLLQKLFMSYIFKNLETFVDQISKNQYLGDFIINSIIQTIPKLQDTNEVKNNPNQPQINSLINNINEQINSLRDTNSQGQILTTSLNDVFDELKLNGNKIFESMDSGNKINNMDQNNPFNISNFNLNQNEYDTFIKNASQNHQNLTGNLININNLTQNPFLNSSNSNKNIFESSNGNDNIISNNNQLNQNLNNNANCKNINNNSIHRENSNIHNRNSDISQKNFNLNANKNTTNYSNEISNLVSNKNMESKEKIQSNLTNSVHQNNLFQNNLNNNLERDIHLQNYNNNHNQSSGANNLLNNNNLIHNMMSMGSIYNPNQISLHNSNNQLQTNIASPFNLSNPQSQQLQMLEKIMNQKNNPSNINKFNQQQQINMIPDLNSISMVSSGAPNSNLTMMSNLIPNLQKTQTANNIGNINPLLGMSYLPLTIQSINHPSLNNQLLQQQQQNLQLLNVNNQLLPMQLGAMQYVNPLQQHINVDMLNKLQGGVGLNNMQNIQGMFGNPQLGFINGMNINQRLLLEGNTQHNLTNSSVMNPLDVNLQLLKKLNNNENE